MNISAFRAPETRKKSVEPRSGGFDLLRLLLAVLVILAHSPELIDGNRHRELFGRLTHNSYLTFGTLAVDGFFILSGYLITQSWMRKPTWRSFLVKRIRRIVPGFVVAFVLSLLLVGVLAPGTSHFFAELMRNFDTLLRLLSLRDPSSPPVLPGMPIPAVNGSMWTIAYEFRCYLLVLILGMCGVFKRPRVLLGISVTTLFVASAYKLQQYIPWPRFHALTGTPDIVFRLTAIFLCGCCFFIYRERIKYRPITAVAGVFASVLACRFSPEHAEMPMAVAGAYLLFYAAGCNWFKDLRSPLPDISYGVYLYAWPIESVWLYKTHGSPWIAFLVTTLLSGIAGYLSWTFVESPFLNRKQRQRHGGEAPLVTTLVN